MTEPQYDFRGLTDLDLIILQQKTTRGSGPEDAEFLAAVLQELGKRGREQAEAQVAALDKSEGLR